MLAEDFRACLLCAALSQLYKKCGLSPATKNSSPVPVFETEFGTNILGVDFNLVFNSNNSRNGNNEFVVCDICFENPSEEFVDRFSQKVETISTLTDEKIIGFVVFLFDVPTSIINFAKNLGVYALCYHDNPVIQPILRIIDEFCNELVIYDLFSDSIIRLRHEIAGFFDGYYPIHFLKNKPYFEDGVQTTFISIDRLIYSYKVTCFAVTSGGYLLHLFSGDTIKLFDTCKITTRIKDNYHYKSIKFQDDPGALLFSLPSDLPPYKMFSNERYITIKTFNGFTNNTFTTYL